MILLLGLPEGALFAEVTGLMQGQIMAKELSSSARAPDSLTPGRGQALQKNLFLCHIVRKRLEPEG